MSELFGNPEQVSELSGNPEQLPYTPTTEEVRNAVWLLKHLDTPLALPDEAGFDRWLAEVKAQAWEEGWSTGRDVWTDRQATAEDMNPYRQGEE